jgi:hypothetical protein
MIANCKLQNEQGKLDLQYKRNEDYNTETRRPRRTKDEG